jgi:hypothetical protein
MGVNQSMASKTGPTEHSTTGAPPIHDLVQGDHARVVHVNELEKLAQLVPRELRGRAAAPRLMRLAGPHGFAQATLPAAATLSRFILKTNKQNYQFTGQKKYFLLNLFIGVGLKESVWTQAAKKSVPTSVTSLAVRLNLPNNVSCSGSCRGSALSLLDPSDRRWLGGGEGRLHSHVRQMFRQASLRSNRGRGGGGRQRRRRARRLQRLAGALRLRYPES